MAPRSNKSKTPSKRNVPTLGDLVIDPQRLLFEGLEAGSFPDLEHLSLARDLARESAEGQCYENGLVRLWHSPQGLYYEFKDFPAAFYGRLGVVSGEYLSEAEAQEIFWEDISKATKGYGEAVVFYTERLMQSEQDFYMAYTYENFRIERGEARFSLPLFMRFETEEGLRLLMRLEREYLAFWLSKGQPLSRGLLA
jgi:hypothetical protein